MYDDLKNKLTGCFYTIFTPFLENDDIDYESLEKYLTVLYKQGARKFYAMAYNSRYSQLNDKEILELNEFCIKTVKRLDKNNIVVVGDPIHGSTKNSAEFAIHAKDTGADLISLIVREKHFEDEQILEHYSQIGNASNMPILVHEMPFLSGYDGKQMHWPKSLITSLPKVPQIIALKEDAHDFEMTKVALSLEPNIRVVIAGTKAKLMQYQNLGVQAYLNGISIIDASIGEKFWQAFKKNDKQVTDFILNELEAPFFDNCAAKYGWHRVNKALLQAAGYMHRRDRMPLKHLSDEQFIEVQNIYSQVDESLSLWKSKSE
jgi:4-hydroxy-tetrahydrodipicolinate synthase